MPRKPEMSLKERLEIDSVKEWYRSRVGGSHYLLLCLAAKLEIECGIIIFGHTIIRPLQRSCSHSNSLLRTSPSLSRQRKRRCCFHTLRRTDHPVTSLSQLCSFSLIPISIHPPLIHPGSPPLSLNHQRTSPTSTIDLAPQP